jgi:hypothetical protein
MLSLFKRRGTIIAEGLKIVGSVTAEGLVEVNGHIEGDLHCTSLVVSRKASIAGSVEADQIVVNGRVEGPFAAARLCSRATPMLWATSSINPWRSSRAPISTGARCARPRPMCGGRLLPRSSTA